VRLDDTRRRETVSPGGSFPRVPGWHAPGSERGEAQARRRSGSALKSARATPRRPRLPVGGALSSRPSPSGDTGVPRVGDRGRTRDRGTPVLPVGPRCTPDRIRRRGRDCPRPVRGGDRCGRQAPRVRSGFRRPSPSRSRASPCRSRLRALPGERRQSPNSYRSLVYGRQRHRALPESVTSHSSPPVADRGVLSSSTADPPVAIRRNRARHANTYAEREPLSHVCFTTRDHSYRST
jgi:hypothetical protein